jgi:outer membrane receptor for ferrienterochelin and colicins
MQQIEITGGRQSDIDARRQATAAKIVIGREELDKFGDATLGEVLRRLPGVSAGGPPGRGGPPRMRGLGGGFTQLLIDGQRVPPGFSLESLPPDQVERIEILRAPTAETGARAIAGTINIITRGGFRRRVNDLRLGTSSEGGRLSGGAFWTHNESAGPLTYNLSAGGFRNQRRASDRSERSLLDLESGELLERELSTSVTDATRIGLNLGARLQWRLNEAGDSLLLNPTVFHSRNESLRSDTLLQPLPLGATPRYDSAFSDGESRFTNARLNTQWRQRLSPSTRMELAANMGQWQSRSGSLRLERRDVPAGVLRELDESSRTEDRSGNLALKFNSTFGGAPDRPGSEHNLVTGLEVEAVRRSDTRVALQNGQPVLPGFAENLSASTLRAAAYVQDEWALSPRWAANAGLRWEGIQTRGDAAELGALRPTNRSSVFTPLGHLAFKPDPNGRDQVRLSLTRSYRNPPTASLIARPSVNSRYPVQGPNEATSPDSVGNPDLRPELALGLDLSVERYMAGGGVLSATVFHRQIDNVIRRVVGEQPEVVPWSPFPRWVARQQNIGTASTQGLELEARWRLDQLVSAAPPVELRQNLALYRSRVDSVPGPDNRLDEQAPVTLNLGADYRLRGTPLTLGGNLNFVGGYRTQTSETRAVETNRRRVFDAYALWAFNPNTALRLTASNLGPLDGVNRTEVDSLRNGRPVRDRVVNTDASNVNWQLRLELKL